MTKGISIILTFVFLAASMVVLYQYEITSMTATAEGVNLTTAPPEYQAAYNASTHVTITSIAISHYTIILVSVFAVVIALVVLILLAKSNRKGM